MPVSVWLASVMVIAGIGLFWYVISTTRDTTAAARGRLTVPTTDLRNVVLARPASERLVQPGMARLADLARVVTPTKLQERVDRKVALAGSPAAWPAERIMALKLLLGVGLAVVGFLRWAGDPSNGRLLVMSVLFTALGFFLPDTMLGIQAKKRTEQIQRELPDVLDQITISVEAGLGFEAALAQVAQHTEGPIGEEFRRTLHDIRLGRTRQQAFDALTDRTDVEELRHFVVSLQQAERLGVPIAQVLRQQASEMRVIRRQRAEEEAQKLPVKMIFPLILCILPALIAVVLGPAIFELIDKFPRF